MAPNLGIQQSNSWNKDIDRKKSATSTNEVKPRPEVGQDTKRARPGGFLDLGLRVSRASQIAGPGLTDRAHSFQQGKVRPE